DAIPYKNQQLWLRLDRPGFLETDPDTKLYTWIPIRKKPADQWILLPFLDRFQKRLNPESRETADEMINKFRTEPKRFFDTVNAHLAYAYPVIPDLDPDAALYQAGFFSGLEKKEIAGFHRAGPDEKLLKSLHSPRVKTLASRILIRNFNMAANPEFQQHMGSLKTGEKIAGYRNDEKYTIPEAMDHIEELEAEMDSLDIRQQNALAQVKAYIHSIS
ncbi:MAG: exodeoxyribonuclease I, partial [Desulfotignum sp.]|nr:exodeoxyribonuclease I [Desulfotignum sp.]